MTTNFLTAAWRKLAMANYVIDPELLKPYLPAHTDLDFFEGKCYVSLVGFLFQDTRVFGVRIPFHINFEEVNLRFYVRYQHEKELRRGVVFIKEIVPRRALSFIANTIYHEHYQTMPMAHSIVLHHDHIEVSYRWKQKSWHNFQVKALSQAEAIKSGSAEEFITEHYWGYTRINDRTTSEYGVEHPRWDIYPCVSYNLDVDFEETYGKDFAFLQHMQPESVFLAEGSAICVKTKRVIR